MLFDFWNHGRTRTRCANACAGRGFSETAERKRGVSVLVCGLFNHGLHGLASLTFAIFGMAWAAVAAEPTISVEARQRYPWNGLVDLNFTITGDAGTKYDTSFTAKDMVGNTNIVMQTIRKSNGVAANAAKEQLLPGNYHWVWDTAADLPKGFKCNRVRVIGAADISAFPYSVKFNANGGTGTMANESFTYGTEKALTANAFKRTGYTFQGWATSASGAKVYNDKQSVSNLTQTSGAVVNLYAVWKARLYMVINLSSGSSSTSYPISYLDAIPDGGWANIHKTTRLILRRCEPGTFKMQGSKNVTLTKPFYIGIFEMTQKQYKLVTGSNPSRASGDMLPVEQVSWSKIKSGSSSFISKIRTRTGVSFDLPTEAQWEYACRAGTTTTYYWGNSVNGAYCWYADNANWETHPVGAKKPNAWGLYDMSGSVMEWCIDYYDSLSKLPSIDPVMTTDSSTSPYTSNQRVYRGGTVYLNADKCTSSCRAYNAQTADGDLYGFRLCLTLSN